MARVLLGNFVWEGLCSELPTDAQGAFDGHLYKCLDTGDSYIRHYGTWVLINLGLSQVKATKSGRIVTDANGFHHVAFVQPFIDNIYAVALSVEDMGALKPAIAFFFNIATTGFDIQTRDTKKGDPFGGVVTSWLATRNYNP